MKILLVEDDDGAALVLKNTLTEQHYLVDLAMDGQTGLSLAEAFAYDIVLLAGLKQNRREKKTIMLN